MSSLDLIPESPIETDYDIVQYYHSHQKKFKSKKANIKLSQKPQATVVQPIRNNKICGEKNGLHIRESQASEYSMLCTEFMKNTIKNQTITQRNQKINFFLKQSLLPLQRKITNQSSSQRLFYQKQNQSAQQLPSEIRCESPSKQNSLGETLQFSFESTQTPFSLKWQNYQPQKIPLFQTKSTKLMSQSTSQYITRLLNQQHNNILQKLKVIQNQDHDTKRQIRTQSAKSKTQILTDKVVSKHFSELQNYCKKNKFQANSYIKNYFV